MPKVIVITGAGTGMGRLAARSLALAGHAVAESPAEPEIQQHYLEMYQPYLDRNEAASGG